MYYTTGAKRKPRIATRGARRSKSGLPLSGVAGCLIGCHRKDADRADLVGIRVVLWRIVVLAANQMLFVSFGADVAAAMIKGDATRRPLTRAKVRVLADI